MNSPALFRPLTPATIGLTGLTPLLAVSATLLSGLAAGLACFFILLLSGATVVCLRGLIPARLRLVYLLLIAATWTTVVDLALQAGALPVRERMGVYLPLLAMNTALLHQLARLASEARQGAKEQCLAILKQGLAAVALLALVGLLREAVARGGVLTDGQGLGLAGVFSPAPLAPGLSLFDRPAGALIAFGLLLAACAAIRQAWGKAPASTPDRALS